MLALLLQVLAARVDAGHGCGVHAARRRRILQSRFQTLQCLLQQIGRLVVNWWRSVGFITKEKEWGVSVQLSGDDCMMAAMYGIWVSVSAPVVRKKQRLHTPAV